MPIRFLTPADVEEYWRVRLRALQEHPEAFGSSYEETIIRPLEERHAQFLNTITSPDSFILGAFVDEKLVGTVGLIRSNRLKQRHRATVVGMYLAPENRGSGLAKELLTTLIKQAATLAGLEQLVLAVSNSQKAAQRLYQSVGFQIYGTDPHALKIGEQYYDEDMLVLDLLDTSRPSL